MRLLVSYIVFFFLCSGLTAVAKPRVVATTSIIGDWVTQIAGDSIELRVLAGPNTDTHTYEPTPKDAVVLAKADLIFENGLGLEYWLPALYDSVAAKATRVKLGDSLPDLLVVHQRCSAHCHHHHHSEYDPHVWLDPSRVIELIELIAENLVTVDPDNAELYLKRKKVYINELKQLDEWIFNRSQEISEDRRVLVTNHDTFAYFAMRYGFENLGNIMGAGTTEGVNPSASAIARIVVLIKENKVPAIFTENVQSSALAKAVAQEARLGNPAILYIEALSTSSGPAASYIDLMHHNVNTIVQSLK